MKQNTEQLQPYTAAYKHRIAKKFIGPLCRTFLMVCLTFVILYPLLYMVSMAFRPLADVYDPHVFWVPTSLTLENIKMTVKDLDYFSLLWHTVYISIVSTAIQLIVTVLTGYAFGRFDFWFKKLWLVLVILTMVVPMQLITLPTYHTFTNLDFFGIIQAITGKPSGLSMVGSPLTLFILAAFGQGIRSGLFILIFMQTFKSMPRELEEAALVDGAGSFRTFVSVMLPNAGTAAVVVGLLSVIWYWNDYYITDIFSGSAYPTLSTTLAVIRSAFGHSMGSATYDAYQMIVLEQSAALLTILPLLILYILTQRKFCESVERVGIVG